MSLRCEEIGTDNIFLFHILTQSRQICIFVLLSYRDKFDNYVVDFCVLNLF